MAHVFRAKSFITDADLGSSADNTGTADDIENQLEVWDGGGSTVDIDEVIAVSSCRLKGDRLFTLIVIEDEIAGG